MRYATASAFRAALEQPLLTSSKVSGLPIPWLRKQVVFDRLLARLLIVAPDRWLLKVALAIDLRLSTGHRPSRDFDLGRHDEEQAATADLVATVSLDVGDFFRFSTERTSALDAVPDRRAVRYRILAELANRRFEQVIVDVGFHESPITAPDLLTGTDTLAFAGFTPLIIPALPLERHVAEKIHAYTQPRPGGRENTRVKDLIDMVLIRALASFSASQVRAALDLTFAAHGSNPVPVRLPLPPSIWEVAYQQLAQEVGLDPDVIVGHRLAPALLDPVLDGSAPAAARWDACQGRWSVDSTAFTG